MTTGPGRDGLDSGTRRPLQGWLSTGLAVGSLIYLAAGTFWADSSTAFPFGPGKDALGGNQSLLGSVDHATAWPYVMVLAAAGATLTFGLVAPWGERWPRCIPYLRGRRVPPGVAIVPSMAVAAFLISAGKGWYLSAARGHLPEEVFGHNWATVIFGASLPVWGLALGTAGYAYWLRRRGTCRRCGRCSSPGAPGTPRQGR